MKTSKIKFCKIHGNSKHELNKIVGNKKYYKCRICKNSRKSDIRKNNKYQLVEYMGKKCQICKYSKCLSALEIHHIVPKEKTLEFSKISRDNKLQDYRNEIDNTPCILVCANCHREIHEGMILIVPIAQSDRATAF